MIDFPTITRRVIAKWRLIHQPIHVRIPLGARKVAFKIEDILPKVSEAVKGRSDDLKVRLKEHPNPMDWDFVVFSKDKRYEVSVRALLPEDGRKQVKHADLKLSCSCPFWRWQGPEFHAQQNNYLFGTPRGTASLPEVKDPQFEHYVCKHALKVLEMIPNYVIG